MRNDSLQRNGKRIRNHNMRLIRLVGWILNDKAFNRSFKNKIGQSRSSSWLGNQRFRQRAAATEHRRRPLHGRAGLAHVVNLLVLIISGEHVNRNWRPPHPAMSHAFRPRNKLALAPFDLRQSILSKTPPLARSWNSCQTLRYLIER